MKKCESDIDSVTDNDSSKDTSSCDKISNRGKGSSDTDENV